MKKTVITFLLLLFVGQVFAQGDTSLSQRPKRTAYQDPNHPGSYSGLWGAFEVNGGTSVIFSSGKCNAQRVGLSAIAGYRFNEYFKVGLGVGGHYYFRHNDIFRNTTSKLNMPIFLDVRGSLISQDTRELVPFWGMDIGTMINDGFFISPTFGLKLGDVDSSWLIGLSLTLQKVKNKEPNPSKVCFASLKVGYEF